MNMPDGNTAALRQHEASEARAELAADLYGERARERILDDLMTGGTVGRRKVALRDIIDGYDLLDYEDTANLAAGNAEARNYILSRLEKRCKELCEGWLETAPGQAEVDELISALDEDARDPC